MKIKVKDIKPGGIEVNDHIDAVLLGLADDDEARFTQPLDVTAKMERVDATTVLAKTHVHGHYKAVCVRCLAEVERDLDGDFVFDFPVDKQTDSIELDEDVRQEVILNIPSKILCRKECKGICPGCGVDLNTGTCKCKGSGQGPMPSGQKLPI